MGSKILLYASVFNGSRIVKNSAGNSDGNEVIVKANTKWRAETSASWIHLQDQTEYTYGEGLIAFTFDKFDNDILLAKRSAVVRIVTPNGIILNSFFINQNSAVSGLRMTTDITGQDVQKDVTVDNGAHQIKFYVYNPAPDDEWELLFRESDVDDWFSFDITEGSATTEVTVTIDESKVSTTRRSTIAVKHKKTGKHGDLFNIYQLFDQSKDYMPSITGGPGDWNANMKFQEIKFGLTSTSYSGFENDSSGITAAENLNIRYSGTGLDTRNHSYYIFNVSEEIASAVDSGGNEYSMLGENRESNVDSKDFKWDSDSYAHFGLDGYSPNDKKDQTGAPIRFREGRSASYSEDLLHHVIANDTAPSFTSSVPLLPDDFKDDSVWVTRKDPVSQNVEKITYKGTGICSVTLHNVYGVDASANDNSPVLKHDKIFKGYKTVDGKAVLDDALTPSGVFKPQNYFVQESGAIISSRSIRLIRMGARNFGGRRSYEEFIGLQKVGKDPITIKIKVIGVAENISTAEDENTHRTYVIPTYSYPIESVGRFKDGGKTIPDNTIHSLGLKGIRDAVRWSDEFGDLFFNISYVDNVDDTSAPSDPQKIGWRFTIQANTKWKRTVAVFKIILYVAVAVAAMVLAYAGVPSTAWAAVWAISAILLLYFELYEGIRKWEREKQNSQWTEDDWNAVQTVKIVSQAYGQLHMVAWAFQSMYLVWFGDALKTEKYVNLLNSGSNTSSNYIFRSVAGNSRNAGAGFGQAFAILQVVASILGIVEIISTWPQLKDPQPNYKYCSAILNEVWVAS